MTYHLEKVTFLNGCNKLCLSHLKLGKTSDDMIVLDELTAGKSQPQVDALARLQLTKTLQQNRFINLAA